ncbi:hypothetical protein [Burkholderia sp. Bp9004]|uniref:hypothetical protein n=1 Tax=Burkholderia sp. Bp9004 TaxID=2184559 RepID=UPI000F5F2E53|nr:hypothetical protein [Burkholderia sp. Bp9004]RQZ60627.1 hypothetical protein DIE08_30410 [Burkholderia sp. Bp9004]
MFEFRINVATQVGLGGVVHQFHTDWIDDEQQFIKTFAEIRTLFPASQGFDVSAVKRSKSMQHVSESELVALSFAYP